MKKHWCFPGFHNWRACGVENYIDISYGGHAESNAVRYECLRCGKRKQVTNYHGGTLSKEEIKLLLRDFLAELLIPQDD